MKLFPGQTHNTWMLFQNTGCQTWTSNLRLGTWNPTPGQDQASAIGGATGCGVVTNWVACNRPASGATPVATGQNVTFNYQVKAPASSGTYPLYVRPLIEGVTWLTDQGVHLEVDSSNYRYAGQVSSTNSFAGVWGYIQSASITLSNYGNHMAHWIGSTDFAATAFSPQWLQTGWYVGTIASTVTTPTWYVEYSDYQGAYGAPTVAGIQVGTNAQYAIWADGTGGSDSVGPYYNHYAVVNGSPANSPTWSTRLQHLYMRSDANGELYSGNMTNEPSGGPCFGCFTGGYFFDLATNAANGTTTWSSWTSAVNTPSIEADAPYSYSANQSYTSFKVLGP